MMNLCRLRSVCFGCKIWVLGLFLLGRDHGCWGKGFDFFAAVGAVVKDDIAASLPHVGAEGGQGRSWGEELQKLDD